MTHLKQHHFLILQLMKEALAILQNRDLDSELRIEAYLALVQCPTAQFANELKNLLDTETVNQGNIFNDLNVLVCGLKNAFFIIKS